MGRLILILLLVANIFSISNSVADSCVKVSENCAEPAEVRFVKGIKVHRECWRWDITYSCVNDKEYSDYCKGIENVMGCTQTGSKCLRKDHDQLCGREEKTYVCGNLLNNPKDITFLDSQYSITKDSLNHSQCDEYEKETCLEMANVCTEGPETRIINGHPVKRDCWKFEKKHTCKTGHFLSDCKELSENCQFIKEDCLSKDEYRGCSHKQKTYKCPYEAGTTTETMSCGSGVYCINGDCQKSEYEPNKNMPKALAHLEMLKNLKDNVVLDGNIISIFKGDKESCHKTTTGFNNCCHDTGWGKNINLAQCSADEKILIDLTREGKCHYVGKYCEEELPFGICQYNVHSYCCFDTKFSRIIQEQGRDQLNIGWGTAENPSCNGFTIDDFKRLDFSKMDFTEIIDDFKKIAVSYDVNKNNEDSESKAMQGYKQKQEDIKNGNFGSFDRNVKATDKSASKIKDYYDR
jgi:conjugal transfer mating pair stabilization protein TraN